MRMPRVRFTVRGMMIVVAATAIALIASDLKLWEPENLLVAAVTGTTALAIEKARRDVERSRSRGQVVGRFRLLGRIGASLPVAVLIVILCCGINIAYDMMVHIPWWISDAMTHPGNVHEAVMLSMRLDNFVKVSMDLCLAWAALSVWDHGTKRGWFSVKASLSIRLDGSWILA